MMKKMRLYLLAALAMFILPSVALADSIVVSVGNTAPTNPFAGGAPLVSGNTYGSAVISSNFVAPFFTDFCGADAGATPSNCDKSWTFNYGNSGRINDYILFTDSGTVGPRFKPGRQSDCVVSDQWRRRFHVVDQHGR